MFGGYFTDYEQTPRDNLTERITVFAAARIAEHLEQISHASKRKRYFRRTKNLSAHDSSEIDDNGGSL